MTFRINQIMGEYPGFIVRKDLRQGNLGDFWFTGEQLQALSAAGHKWLYTDKVSDYCYQSELNMHMTGVANILLPALTNYHKSFDKKSYTEAMMGQCLLNDIPVSAILCNKEVVYEIYKILDRYQMDQAKCNFYWQKNIVKGTNPKIRITSYLCPNGKNLVVVENKYDSSEQTIIDFNEFRQGNYDVTDEYRNNQYKVINGILKITVPARSFMLIGIKTK